MPVLAAMGERKARRIREAAGRAVHDLSDQRKRPHRAGADSRRLQQIGKVDRSALGGGREIAVKAPQVDVARAHVVMRRQDEMR